MAGEYHDLSDWDFHSREPVEQENPLMALLADYVTRYEQEFDYPAPDTDKYRDMMDLIMQDDGFIEEMDALKAEEANIERAQNHFNQAL